MKWLKKYGWLLLSCVVPFIIYYGWRCLEVLIYGEPETRQVDNIIAFILSASMISNIILLITLLDAKKIAKESETSYRETYTSLYTSLYNRYDTAVNSLRTVSSNLKVTDMILSETIKNESGKESKCVMKYPDIQSLATHIKCMNDLNMNYMEEQLHIISNMNKEEKES